MSIEIVRNAPKMEKDIVMTFPVRLMSFIRHISELSTGIATNGNLTRYMIEKLILIL